MSTKKYIVKEGDRFGRLVILRENPTYSRRFGTGRRECFYDVRCDCGTEFTTRRMSLIHGLTRSCGCLRNDILASRINKREGKKLLFVTYNGDRKSLVEWAEITGIKLNTLYSRLYRHGDDPQIVLKEYVNGIERKQ